MAEKMKGVITQLITRGKTGDVDSEVIFKPFCDVFLEEQHDYLGATKYSDISVVIEEFGVDVAEKVMAGELVEVERDLPPNARITYCPGPYRYIKVEREIRHPVPGWRKEYLVRDHFDK